MAAAPRGSTASQPVVRQQNTALQVTNTQGAPKLEMTQAVLWGDPHSHSGLSPDGCENPEEDCVAEVQGAPGLRLSERAAFNGLDWFAMTEHVEFDAYEDLRDGTELSIWDTTLTMAAQAPGQYGVVLYPGYEWRDCSAGGTHHRTVVFESPTACAGLRPAACPSAKRPKSEFGYENYVRRGDRGRTTAQELADHLSLTSEMSDCQTRWVAFAHHSAYERPGAVDWQDSADRMDEELLLEIFSEHGSSECIDLEAEGCDYHVREVLYLPEGSAQAALQAGLRVGFVAGTDSHDANPGSIDDGPGTVAKLEEDGDEPRSAVAIHPTSGGVTGVLLAPGQSPYAEAVFDGLLARHTVASTTTLDGLQIWVQDPMGQVYLPGDVLPQGTYQLKLEMPFAAQAELVNDQGEAEPVDGWFTVQDEVRYLRLRFEMDGEEHRLWASPFFPAD